mmetsp:Transcript_13544/g.23330  ORF Transcript_13544/g.23330 Transcript_13544/m.23330 type:complete len:715 (+) Transcript_13544:4833-6977(+)
MLGAGKNVLNLKDREERALEGTAEVVEGSLKNVLINSVTSHDTGELGLGTLESVVGHVAEGLGPGLAKSGELALEEGGLLDLAGVSELHGTDHVTGLHDGTSGLVESDGTRLKSTEGHVHFHDLNLSKGIALLEFGAILYEVAEELATHLSTHLGRVVLILKEAGLAIDHVALSTNVLLDVCDVRVAANEHKEATVGEAAKLGINKGVVAEQAVSGLTGVLANELVLDTLVDELELVSLVEELGGRELATLEHAGVIRGAGGDLAVGRAHTTNDGNGERVHLGDGNVALDTGVEPSSVELVGNVVFGLNEVLEVLDGGTDLTTNGKVVEGHGEVTAGLLTSLTPSKNMTNLGVSKLVNTTRTVNTEVTPNVAGAAEVDFSNLTDGRLESVEGVLSSNTSSDGVAASDALDGAVLTVLILEVNDFVSIEVLTTVEAADVRDAVEGDTHGNLDLAGRYVGSGDHLSDRVLNLETRVELQEEELIVVVVKVLDGTGVDVANLLGKTDGSVLHLLPDIGLGGNGGTLLENLLVTTLYRAVTSAESDGVTVLVSNELNLQVASTLGETHDEDRGSGDLRLDLAKACLDLGVVVDKTDTLTTTTFTGLDHDGNTNLLDLLQGFLYSLNVSLIEDLVGDTAIVLVVHTDVRTVPGNHGAVTGLSDNAAHNLVTKSVHGASRGANKNDAKLGEGAREQRVLTGVTPASPHGIDLVLLSDLDD